MRAEFDPRVAYRAVLLALGLLAAGLLFEQLVQIVMLVTIAVVIAVPLAATASWLRRWGVPRAVGAVLALLAGAAVTGVLLAFVVPTFVSQVNDFIAQLPTTAAHFERTINNVLGLKRGTTTKAVTQFVNRYTHHPAVLLGPLAQIGVSIATTWARSWWWSSAPCTWRSAPIRSSTGWCDCSRRPGSPTSGARWSASASRGWPGCAASPWTCSCSEACSSWGWRSSGSSSPRASRSSRR